MNQGFIGRNYWDDETYARIEALIDWRLECRSRNPSADIGENKMTANDIRQYLNSGSSDVTASCLCEIAAQLAELNEWLRTPQATKDAIESQIRGR